MRKLLAVAFLMTILLPPVSLAEIAGWEKTLGGEDWEEGECVRQTSDEGYVVTGTTIFSEEEEIVFAVLLIKTDSLGNEEWTRIFGESGFDWGSSVRQTTDGGYIITGDTYSIAADTSYVYLVKTDSLGNEQWSRTFDGYGGGFGYDVEQTSDGGYIVAGSGGSFGGDALLIKTNSLGNEQWVRTYGQELDDWATTVRQTSDGGYVIAGLTDFSMPVPPDFIPQGDIWLFKTDSSGNELWNNTYGEMEHWRIAMEQTSDGGFVIVNGSSLIKTDNSGNELWRKTTNNTTNFSVWQTADGGYALAGEVIRSSHDASLMKVDRWGNEEWGKSFGGWGEDWATSLQQTTDGGFIITGTKETLAGDTDVWLIKAFPPDLLKLRLQAPADGAVLTEPPLFSWGIDGGTKNVFALDISLRPDFATFYSTYENLHIPLHETSLQMPERFWDMIPSDTVVYWRVRGADRAAEPPAIINSTEAWSFYKE